MSIVEYGNLEYVLAYPIIVCTSLLIFSRDTRAVEGVLPGIVRKADHAWWGYDQWKGNKKRWSKLWHLRSLCQDLDKDFFWKVGGAEIFGRRVCFDSAADLFGDLGVSTGCWGIETAQLASSSQDLPIDFTSSSCWRWSGAVGGFSASCRPMTRRGEAQYLKLLKLLVLGNI